MIFRRLSGLFRPSRVDRVHSRTTVGLVTWTAGLTAVLAVALAGFARAVEDSEAAAEARLSASVKYLASDELEGRGVGTEGLNKAAEYIAGEFTKLGLKVDLFNGSPYQAFQMTTSAEMGPKDKNRLALVGPPAKEGDQPARVELKLGADFNSLSLGGSGQFDAPVVFVGYGISSTEPAYDEYAGLDVKGKVVVMIRKEPQQNNPHSLFDGTQPSRHALFTRKVSNAYEHEAAAVIIINDQYDLVSKADAARKAWQESVDKLAELNAKYKENKSPSPEDFAKHRAEVEKLADEVKKRGQALDGDFDALVPFSGAGEEGGNRFLPVFFASRTKIEPLIKATLGKDLATIEQEIDKDLKPQSAALMGWSAAGEANIERKQAEVKNVVAVLEGEGPLADETIVVGAHYDHLGRGGPGSLAPWTNDIHNGADDNASGASSLLEVAHLLASREKKLPRRVVFIAFTAEERGLIGSAHYVREPRYPLSNTIAMLNMDMVGRLVDDKLVVYGTGTAPEFDKLVDELNKPYHFKITKKASGFGPSDQSSFYAKEIPVMHFFTGTHTDYHRPSDDFEKINVPGMRRVTQMVADTVVSIASNQKRPEYLAVKSNQVAARGGGGDRPYFGSIPDFAQEVEGYALMGVSKDSPADKAGLKSGDIIVRLGQSKIGGLEDFDSALRKYKAGEEVPVTVKRGKEEVTLPVKLGAPK